MRKPKLVFVPLSRRFMATVRRAAALRKISPDELGRRALVRYLVRQLRAC